MKKEYVKPELEELKFTILERMATGVPIGSAGFEDDEMPDDIG